MILSDETIFELPVRLDFMGAIKAANGLFRLPDAQKVELNFKRLNFVSPFGMLYFAQQLKQFRSNRQHARFVSKNYEHLDYAAHMGFFQSFGMSFGKTPGEAPGSSQYVPLTCLSFDEVKEEASQKYEDVRETLEGRAMKLATILVRQDGGPLHETITFSLREIFRNVFEHSGSNSIWYAAQYLPGNDSVELCILDDGVGISSTLKRNPHLTIKTDSDALQLAILPGISGVAFKGARKPRKDFWANSGYGLFMTSQLCLKGGSFAIISGDSGLFLQKDESKIINGSFSGTALQLHLNLVEVGDLNNSLEQLRKRGNDIAGTLKQSANVTASMSSRMLAKRD